MSGAGFMLSQKRPIDVDVTVLESTSSKDACNCGFECVTCHSVMNEGWDTAMAFHEQRPIPSQNKHKTFKYCVAQNKNLLSCIVQNSSFK